MEKKYVKESNVIEAFNNVFSRIEDDDLRGRMARACLKMFTIRKIAGFMNYAFGLQREFLEIIKSFLDRNELKDKLLQHEFFKLVFTFKYFSPAGDKVMDNYLKNLSSWKDSLENHLIKYLGLIQFVHPEIFTRIALNFLISNGLNERMTFYSKSNLEKYEFLRVLKGYYLKNDFEFKSGTYDDGFGFENENEAIAITVTFSKVNSIIVSATSRKK